MAKTHDGVMKMVEQELSKNPEVSVAELFQKAKGVSSGVSRLTRRQFHARYPLQVKRRRKPASRGSKGAGAGKRAGRGRRAVALDQRRDSVRKVFLKFAQDVTAAEARKDLVSVIMQVDRYVDDAVQAATK